MASSILSLHNSAKYLKAGDESFDEMKDYFKWYFDSSIDIKVTKRIPAEFILKYEKTQKNHIEYDDYAQLHHQSKGWDIGWTSPGTWGPSGAGILVYCPRTDEILLLKRANWVDEPNVWGIPGGACKVTKSGKEKALVAAVSESRDEMGDIPRGKIRVKPYIFHKQGTSFIFETFILEINVFVRKSFVPRLNSENTDHNWFKRIDLIEGKLEIHSGLKELMENYVF